MNFYEEIKIRYGNVKRTRGFYLYTEKNIRILDLYLDGGMSIFGRKGNQVQLVLKQFADKGLYSFLPTTADNNLKKALNALFPEHTEIAFYTDCSEVLNWLKMKISKNSFDENLWKPLLPSCDELKKQPLFFVQPPFCTTTKIAVFKKEFATQIPSGENISAIEKACLAKAFFKLPQFIEKSKKINNKHDIAKKLCKNFWQVENIYLFPKIKKEEYELFFKRALDSHILISPYFSVPSILPKIDVYSELINFLKTQIGPQNGYHKNIN